MLFLVCKQFTVLYLNYGELKKIYTCISQQHFFNLYYYIDTIIFVVNNI